MIQHKESKITGQKPCKLIAELNDARIYNINDEEQKENNRSMLAQSINYDVVYDRTIDRNVIKW